MWNLEDFVRESNRIEGIIREPLHHEIEAHKKFLAFDGITVSVLEEFVATIQPGAVLRRETWQNVQVGNHIAPPGGPEIEKQLITLLLILNVCDARSMHICYEILHPFTDCNGRSGRALWLWLMKGKAPLGFLHQFYYQTLAAKES